MGTIKRDLDATVSRARHVGLDKTKLVIDPASALGNARSRTR